MPHIHELYDFTVSFFILHPTEKRICLHYHRKLGFWNQLGGHIELDEQPMQTVERELIEEAGLYPGDYQILETDHPKLSNALALSPPFSLIVYKYGDSAHKHIDMPYIVQSKKTDLTPAEGESSQIGWFSSSEIDQMYDDGVLDKAVLDICNWIFTKYM